MTQSMMRWRFCNFLAFLDTFLQQSHRCCSAKSYQIYDLIKGLLLEHDSRVRRHFLQCVAPLPPKPFFFKVPRSFFSTSYWAISYAYYFRTVKALLWKKPGAKLIMGQFICKSHVHFVAKRLISCKNPAVFSALSRIAEETKNKPPTKRPMKKVQHSP